jgi:hypothetical protein
VQARDFVVGKEAVAGALAKVKDSGALGAVEQEQIRNLYKKADGSYAAYQWYVVLSLHALLVQKYKY